MGFLFFIFVVLFSFDIIYTNRYGVRVCHASPTSIIGIRSFKKDYDSDERTKQKSLVYDDAKSFFFERYLSPQIIQEALSLEGRRRPFKWHEGKDGRRGYVSSTKLCGDWVLAQSKQVAVQTTAKEVVKAYLTEELQEKWNEKDVIKCKFTCRDIQDHPKHYHHDNDSNDLIHDRLNKYYQQDLVLRSQRVITKHTGIMKYSQVINIDQIGKDKYSISICLLDDYENEMSNDTSTRIDTANTNKTKRPFDSLSVHVGLEQDGENVNIYANGIMKVNREVVPNLIVFDASGIAGSMAGKGTLWLAAHFFEKQRESNNLQK